ncbi:MAG: membrane protein insertase YidC [Burkholderiales bacterium]|nr:membrane protein insertase YidC [Burkholderiales bacterium]
MDFQRTVLWVIFAMSLLFLWDGWQRYQGRPSLLGGPPAPTASMEGNAPPATAAPAVPAPAADSSVPQPSATPAPAAAAPGSPAAVEPPALSTAGPTPGQKVRVETDLLRADFDLAGAVLARAELLQHRVAPDWTAAGLLALVTGKKQDRDANVVLLEVSPTRVYVAQSGLIGGAELPSHRTPFVKLDGPTRLEPGQDKLEVRFVAESGGVRMTKTYTFRRGQYAIDVRHDIENIGQAEVQPSVYLQLMRDGNKPEGESGMYYTFTGPAVFSEAAKFQKLDFADIDKRKQSHVTSADNGWISMIQHYFVSAWVPPAGKARENYSRAVDKNLYAVGTISPLGAIAPGASASFQSTLYVGPQEQRALETIAPGLELVVDYGWLTVIAKPLFWLLQFLHGLVGNWGWAIVLLTVLIKAAFYPLSAASYKSMAKMKEVTPRLMKLREQYGDDKQKLNVAMMELYKTEKINPLGGCLPILVQIPVFIALYWVLLASAEMRNQPWILWVTDLATPDPWFILPLLMMATMWIQYKLNPTPPDPVQAKVMAAMPFIFGIMFFMFPAGLVLYWLVNNILSITQQWYVTRQIAAARPVG